MRVIKEGYVLYNTMSDTYYCMQNTATPKIYASKQKAKDGASYHNYQTNKFPSEDVYVVKQVFLVEGEDNDNQAI